jgi:hypothetical protein
MQYSVTPQHAHHPAHHAAVVGGEIPTDECARGAGAVVSDLVPNRAEAAAAGAPARAAIRLGFPVFPSNAGGAPHGARAVGRVGASR